MWRKFILWAYPELGRMIEERKHQLMHDELAELILKTNALVDKIQRDPGLYADFGY